MSRCDIERSITVCLTNWRRPQHLEDTIESLTFQSIKPTIFMWNNGPAFEHSGVNWTVSSSVNHACWPRWFMASYAQTEFVCIVDDDVILGDCDLLVDIMSRLSKCPLNCIAGVEGVNLISGKSYIECEHLRIPGGPGSRDVACDIVKGKFMMVRTSALRSHLRWIDPSECVEDDIVVSSYLAETRRKQHICLSSVGHRFNLVDAPHALWRKPGHFDRRQSAVLRYFPDYETS